MILKRIGSLFVCICCLVALALPVSAAEMDSGSVYCFSSEEFSAEERITGICITQLPKEAGCLMLGSRILCEGDILTADQVSQMTFSSTLVEQDRTVELGYLPIYEDAVAPCATMSVFVRGKENLEPVAEDQALETYKNLPLSEKLKASDPEGESLTFTLKRSPKRGEVSIGEDGSFTYTPKKNKVGVDSFTYTAADASGKLSREATVTVTILKPTNAPQYTDTLGQDCQFAAEWMKNTGVFVGETVGDKPCFVANASVSRGQFVTMLVKTLALETEAESVYTGYADEIPGWLQPYLAAAIRSGLTAGLPDQQTFGADTPITGGEAAVMLQNALDLSLPTSSEALSPMALAVSALSQQGMTLCETEVLTRGQAAQVLYQTAKYMAK